MTPTSDIFIRTTETDPAAQALAVFRTSGQRLLAALRPKVAMLTELELGTDAREAALAVLTDFCAGPVRRYLTAIDGALYAPAAGSPETRLLIRALRTAATALDQDIDTLARTDDARRAKTIAQNVGARLDTHLAVERAVLLPALAGLPGVELAALAEDFRSLLGGGRLERPAVPDVTDIPHGRRHPPATGTRTRRADGTRGTRAPYLLCDTRALTVITEVPAGELWRLSEPGRELDAGITRLLPGQRVDTHTEEDPDVLLLILTGDATVATPHGPRHLPEGTLLWLPRGSTAGLTAGENGLSCLTVHPLPPGAPDCRAKRSTPRQPPGSPAPPGDTVQPDWPKWLC